MARKVKKSAPKKRPTDEITAESAAEDLGVTADMAEQKQATVTKGPFLLDDSDIATIKYCRRAIAQIDILRNSASWHDITVTSRLFLKGAQTFARQLIGETAPMGEPSTLPELLGEGQPMKYAGVLRDPSKLALQRRKLTEAQLAEYLSQVS